MFILDRVLLSPVSGFMWLVRELHNAAQREIQGEAENLSHRLTSLYMQLETGQITDAQFDEQEQQILSRLEALRAAGSDENIDADAEDDPDAADADDAVDVDDQVDADAEIDEAEENADAAEPDVYESSRGQHEVSPGQASPVKASPVEATHVEASPPAPGPIEPDTSFDIAPLAARPGAVAEPTR